MPNDFTPSGSFLQDFENSLSSNVTQFDLAWDTLGGAATITESVGNVLASQKGTAASMFAAGVSWFQGTSDYYRQMASDAAVKGASGNVIQQNIATLADNMANEYAADASALQAASSSSASEATIAETVAEVARGAGAAIAVAQIIDKAMQAPDGDQATITALRTTAESVGSLAGGEWGLGVGLALAAGFGIVGFPV